jgi:hypothetical protein
MLENAKFMGGWAVFPENRVIVPTGHNTRNL